MSTDTHRVVVRFIKQPEQPETVRVVTRIERQQQPDTVRVFVQHLKQEPQPETTRVVVRFLDGETHDEQG